MEALLDLDIRHDLGASIPVGIAFDKVAGERVH